MAGPPHPIPSRPPLSLPSLRQVLRDHNCLQTLLQHLRSHSLTIVSNACGTLWNLSARSPRDQEIGRASCRERV